MLNIFKFKLLILTFMVVQPLCSAINFTKIFLGSNESYEAYKNRMFSNNLPCVGDSFDAYKTKMLNNGKPHISFEEFQIFMNSVPRIYETLESITDRNAMNMRINNNIRGLQFYMHDELIRIMDSRYPRLYESYQEYTARLKSLDAEPFPHSMFKSFKNDNFLGNKHCLRVSSGNSVDHKSDADVTLKMFPNIGEIYDEYESRVNSLGFEAFNKTEFRSFFNLIPRPEESYQDYQVRCVKNTIKNLETGNVNKWVLMRQKDYEGLKLLVPQNKETYESYKTRITNLDLVPMSMESFNFSYFFTDIFAKK